jgi:hypothetical protein
MTKFQKLIHHMRADKARRARNEGRRLEIHTALHVRQNVVLRHKPTFPIWSYTPRPSGPFSLIDQYRISSASLFHSTDHREKYNLAVYRRLSAQSVAAK